MFYPEHRPAFKRLIVSVANFRSSMAAADLTPCLSAFLLTRAFPSSVLGPVLVAQGLVR